MTTDITSEQINDYITGKTEVPLDPRELGLILAAGNRAQGGRLRERVSIEMNVVEASQLWAKAEAYEAYFRTSRDR